jgi:hypothetical protein
MDYTPTHSTGEAFMVIDGNLRIAPAGRAPAIAEA